MLDKCCADLSDFVTATKSCYQLNHRACWAPECNDYDFECHAPALQQVVVHLPHAKLDRVPDVAVEAKSGQGSDRNSTGKSLSECWWQPQRVVGCDENENFNSGILQGLELA